MPVHIHPELEEIKQEIQSLKILIVEARQAPKQAVSLGGMLKGIKISEDDIEDAKKSLFKFGA